MKKNKGSAILIAVFLVAAVGGVAFGIGRMFLVESNLSSTWENSTVAYYAAESGVEEGLLRYKYNKNQEISPDGTNVLVVDLSSNSINNVLWNPLLHINDFNSGDSSYASSIKYLQKYYGQDIDINGDLTSLDVINNDSTEYFIPRDQSLKLDLSALNKKKGDINLMVRFTKDDTTTEICDYATKKAFMEAKLTGSTPVSDTYQMAAALVHRSHIYDLSPQTILPGPPIEDVLSFEKLIGGIRQLTQSPIYNTDTPLELTLKPIGCSAKIGITSPASTENNPLIPGPYNTIKSTGYFGGVTRTIEVKVDRQSGTVYDLYDYVLYKR